MNDVACAFVAYPSDPLVLDHEIREGVRRANIQCQHISFSTWKENDIAGKFIIDPVIEKIDDAQCIIADVTRMNFNVTYEIGYAIGRRKRVYLVRNKSVTTDDNLVRSIGIFDTLGYLSYENSMQLTQLLCSFKEFSPLKISQKYSRKSPVYVLEPPSRSEAIVRMIARIKKARLMYRSFDPSEQTRLPAPETIEHVASSYGVVVPLLSKERASADIHNIRAAFVAGLAHGMSRVTLILQEGADPIPLDVRDFVKYYKYPQDIDEHISAFALEVVEAFQASVDPIITKGSILEDLDLGSATAENEFQTLGDYYLRTAEFQRALRGEVNLIIGRKGSGKTALFSQVRNVLRSDKANIVVDLKPEGYQLIKFKEQVLDLLEDGSKIHVAVAFWEYIILLEICYKIIEKDRDVHLRDHKIFEPFQELRKVYDAENFAPEGDFSERLLALSDHLAVTYQSEFGDEPNRRLTNSEVTQLLYLHDLKRLRNQISQYLRHKRGVWVLFDNLDKGWSTHGVSSEDVIIIQGLIDAARKIEREMQRDEHAFHSIVFIRNDVYDLLVAESADRGKDIRVSLDWSEPDLLREMFRKRLVYNDLPEDAEFDALWRSIVTSHIKGEESSQYLIERSLMRPRYLLNMISHCRGFAVNFGHSRISEEDILKGLEAYSTDLVIDTDLELRDIEPAAENLIYHFIGESYEIPKASLDRIFGESGIPKNRIQRIMKFLLWFGFLGIRKDDEETVYIYSVGYDINKLIVLAKKVGKDNPVYRINPAFWPGLGILTSDAETDQLRLM